MARLERQVVIAGGPLQVVQQRGGELRDLDNVVFLAQHEELRTRRLTEEKVGTS